MPTAVKKGLLVNCAINPPSAALLELLARWRTSSSF